MGCKKLTYHETLSPLKVVCSDLSVSGISCVGSYRYGYQGSEMDNEVKGQGNSYTTHFRMLDPRVGRWLSPDPRQNELPWQSPYVSMDNDPIRYNDSKGDIPVPVVVAVGKGVFWLVTTVFIVDAAEEVVDYTMTGDANYDFLPGNNSATQSLFANLTGSSNGFYTDKKKA